MQTNGAFTNTERAPRRLSVGWGGAFGGTLLALALSVTVGSLWVALGYGSRIAWARGSALEWWLAATAVAAAWLGGGLATRIGRPPDSASAHLTATMVWALFFLAFTPLGYLALHRLVGTPAAWLWFPTLVLGGATANLGATMAGSALDRGEFGGMSARTGPVPPHEHRGGEVVDLREGQAPPAEWRSPTRTGS